MKPKVFPRSPLAASPATPVPAPDANAAGATDGGPEVVALTEAEKVAFRYLRAEEVRLAAEFERCGKSVMDRAKTPAGSSYAFVRDAAGCVVEVRRVRPQEAPQGAPNAAR